MVEIIHGNVPINTSASIEVKDITSDIQNWVSKKKANDGILLVFSMHTTAGLVVNEAESGLLKDIEEHLEKIVPPGAGYKHDRVDNNAHSHIITSLVGPSEQVPVQSGKLNMGTWQRILFVEGDGGRSRRVSVTFIGSVR